MNSLAASFQCLFEWKPIVISCFQNPGSSYEALLLHCTRMSMQHRTLLQTVHKLRISMLCFSGCFRDPTNYLCCESDTMDAVDKIYYIFHMCK